MSSDPILTRLERVAKLAEPRASSDFDLNNDEGRTHAPELRDASVLIPFIKRESGWQIILTKRTSALKHHPGQIAFPGGKRDEGDVDAVATALREAEEEIGLPQDNVRILGQIGRHETVTRFNVTPVLGIVETAFEPVPEAGEVETVFEVPLAHLVNPRMSRVEGRFWQGRFRRYYVIPYGPFYIWGATARMIMGFAQNWDQAQ